MNTTRTPFDDMPNDLDFDAQVEPTVVTAAMASERKVAPASAKAYTSPCKRCGGSGTVRPWGTCFLCRGSGQGPTYKTSPEQRAHTREVAAAREVRKAAEEAQRIAQAQAQAWELFCVEQPAAAGWITKGAEKGNEFARSMRASVAKWGRLTERQQAAVEAAIERDKAQAQAAAEKPASAALEALPALHAVMQKHAKFYAGDLTLSRRNADQLVWIKHANAEKVIGKIDAGRLSLWTRPGVDMAEVRGMLAEFEGAPLQTAMKYGKLSGVCCSCGRELTNDGSIEAGIGPICAGKFAG